MYRLLAAFVFVCGSTTLSAGGKAVTFTFAKSDLGKLPAGWAAALTGKKGGIPVWKVVADATGPSGTGMVLAQTTKSPNASFNVCVADKTKYADLEIAVAFKAVAGDVDQGGGPVWRYQDANNYYIARANPLEENYRLYRVEGGLRKQLATVEKVAMKSGQWYTLKIVHVGDKIECYLDGKKMLEAKDNAFPGPGPVGLWTKADAETYFDAFTVQALSQKKEP